MPPAPGDCNRVGNGSHRDRRRDPCMTSSGAAPGEEGVAVGLRTPAVDALIDAEQHPQALVDVEDVAHPLLQIGAETGCHRSPPCTCSESNGKRCRAASAVHPCCTAICPGMRNTSPAAPAGIIAIVPGDLCCGDHGSSLWVDGANLGEQVPPCSQYGGVVHICTSHGILPGYPGRGMEWLASRESSRGRGTRGGYPAAGPGK